MMWLSGLAPSERVHGLRPGTSLDDGVFVAEGATSERINAKDEFGANGYLSPADADAYHLESIEIAGCGAS